MSAIFLIIDENLVRDIDNVICSLSLIVSWSCILGLVSVSERGGRMLFMLDI